MVTGKKKYEKQAVQQFVEEQVQKYAVLDRADPNAKALAANRVVEAVVDLYEIPEAGEEQEFVTTTTRRVVEQFFYNAEKQTFDVTKTMSATTSMPAAAAGISAGAPSFAASREAEHTEQRTADGTFVKETLSASEVYLVLIYPTIYVTCHSCTHFLPSVRCRWRL